jgi:hypothetical protein
MPVAAGGRIGRTVQESEPSFAPVPRPLAGAPHVVMVVLDDLGFAQLRALAGVVVAIGRGYWGF